MNEDIAHTLLFDESVPFAVIEPFDLACCSRHAESSCLDVGEQSPSVELGIEIIVWTYLTPVKSIEFTEAFERRWTCTDDCGDLLLRNNETVVQAVKAHDYGRFDSETCATAKYHNYLLQVILRSRY
jgi:hypothetical protein